MKTLILVNTLQSVNTFVYGNHIEFVTYCKWRFPKSNFLMFNPLRMSIDMARNTAAQMALANKCDYLMFVDDDVMVPKNAFEKLFNAKKDIIAGLTYIRGYPFKPMVFKSRSKKLHDGKKIIAIENWEPPKNKISKCDAVGFSCALINCDVLKALEPPYFVTGTYQTEDIYFCCKVTNELRPKPGIFVDSSVHTYHFLSPEAVGAGNVEKLRKFYKPPKSHSGERSVQYVDMCLKNI